MLPCFLRPLLETVVWNLTLVRGALADLMLFLLD